MPATLGWVGLILPIIAVLLLFVGLWMPPKTERVLDTAAGVRCVVTVLVLGVAVGLLCHANLTHANLSHANLADANLTDANFSDANLTDASLALVFQNESRGAKYGAGGGNYSFGADLSRAIVVNVDLTGADFAGAKLTDADLSNTDLIGTDLRMADLTRAHLQAADLTKARLEAAHLSGADLTGADLTDADLSGADLTGADLTDVNLRRICKYGVAPVLPETAQLPDNRTLADCSVGK